MNDKPSHLRVVGEEPETIELKEASPRTFEDLVLKDVQYGDELLCELTDDQAALFVRIFDLTEEQRNVDREISGTLFEKFGRDIRSGSLDEQQQYDLSEHVDPALAKRAFNLKALSDKLKSELFYELGETHDAHDYLIVIRSKRRAVRTKRKW